MKFTKKYGVLVIIAIMTLCGSVYLGAWYVGTQFKVVYSLDTKHVDQEIIRLINEADSYVYFGIYYFSKTDIADALVRAHKRGILVAGITDREGAVGNNKNVIVSLRSAGIPVITQKHPEGIMHLKVLVTDKAYASGSYNWTRSATEVNDEVLEISTNESVRRQYLTIIKKVLSANQ